MLGLLENFVKNVRFWFTVQSERDYSFNKWEEKKRKKRSKLVNRNTNIVGLYHWLQPLKTRTCF